MKIAITGPHGAGKSTLLRAIKSHPDYQKLRLDQIPEITREVQALGYPINEEGNNETQNLCIARCLNDILSRDNYIVDRAILDQAIYTDYMNVLGQVDRTVVQYAYAVSDMYMKWYNHVFYIPAEFEIENDGVRSTGKAFHDFVVQAFEREITNLEKTGEVVITRLTGSVEERVNTFFSTLRGSGVI